MLPQYPAIRVGAADTPRSARNGRSQTAQIQPVRGELIPAGSSGTAELGVTRTFVLSIEGNPLMPCSNARARILITKGKAKVYRLFPFTIQLTQSTTVDVQPIAIKLDPGAKTTGIALVRQHGDDPTNQTVLHLAELTHRGAAIRKHITQRATFRRRRRFANLLPRPALHPSDQARRLAPAFTSITRRHQSDSASSSKQALLSTIMDSEKPSPKDTPHSQSAHKLRSLDLSTGTLKDVSKTRVGHHQ